jgi:hypothetical protein
MSIELKCVCGKPVYAEDHQRGQHLQCPHCGGLVTVPSGTASAAPASPKTQALYALVGCAALIAGTFIFSESIGKLTARMILIGSVLGAIRAVQVLCRP